jgi:toxin ParE1/3/4
MIEIVWKQGAENDLLQVFSNLQDWREGAGERFVLALDASLNHLRVHPEIAPLFDRPMRRMVVGASGYGIFYTIETRRIFIHALIHLSQNPEAIRDKIRKLLDLQ